MKTKILNIAVVTLISCSFWACDDKNTEDGQRGNVPAVLAGKAYTFDPADAGEPWKSGKTVGIYMLKENTAEYISPYQNVKYQTTVEPIGYFTPAAKEDVLYYPQDGSKVDVIAYYPWKENLTNDCYPINVSNQASASNYTFLYAANSRGLSKDNNKTILQLRPVLSQLVFKLQAGDGVTDAYLAEASVIISGMKTKADFNLLSGQFNTALEMKNITCAALAEGNGGSAQVLPAISTEGYSVTIELPKMNRTYEWIVSENIQSLEQGIRYLNTVKISLEKIEVITKASPIEEWQDGSQNTGSGDENAISTLIEDLPLGKLTYGRKYPMVSMSEGTWFYTRDNDVPDDKLVVSTVEHDETLGRNVIHTVYANNTVWNCVGYRMKNAKAQVYTVRFRAKGSAKATLRCYIKTNTNNYIIANNKGTGANPYNGYVLVTLTEEYTDFALDFNFTKSASSVYSYPESALVDVVPAALTNFYIAFGGNTNVTGGLNFYLDDISLAKKQ